jgi:hypothetical protein
LAKTNCPQGRSQSPHVSGAPEKPPYYETGHCRSAAQISLGAQGKKTKKMGVTDGLPQGTGLPSKSTWSKTTKILASQVLTLIMESNKSLDSKPNNENELLLEGSEGKSNDGTQLRFGMEALQQLVYTKGSVASIFANIVSNAQTSGQEFFEDFNAAIADIFHGDENPDPVALTTALEQDASEGQAYLVVMNNDAGFTLLHILQCMDRKIWPGDPISGKVLAFGGDIHPSNATPNVFVFDKDNNNLFMQVHLPPTSLLQTIKKYKPSLYNDQK